MKKFLFLLTFLNLFAPHKEFHKDLPSEEKDELAQTVKLDQTITESQYIIPQEEITSLLPDLKKLLEIIDVNSTTTKDDDDKTIEMRCNFHMIMDIIELHILSLVKKRIISTNRNFDLNMLTANHVRVVVAKLERFPITGALNQKATVVDGPDADKTKERSDIDKAKIVMSFYKSYMLWIASFLIKELCQNLPELNKKHTHLDKGKHAWVHSASLKKGMADLYELLAQDQYATKNALILTIIKELFLFACLKTADVSIPSKYKIMKSLSEKEKYFEKCPYPQYLQDIILDKAPDIQETSEEFESKTSINLKLLLFTKEIAKFAWAYSVVKLYNYDLLKKIIS
jgi:hypothetical protein